jgi:hypothetical protein
MLPEKENFIKEKQLFKWTQANFNNPKVGNRGIISNVHDKPLRVVFTDDLTKSQMTSSQDEIDWQKKYYYVDVEIQYDGKNPKSYKIIRNHHEECFPLDD